MLEAAFTVRMPVCSERSPASETLAEATWFEVEYGAGETPETVGSGPLPTVTGEPNSGKTFSCTDSPNAELAPLEAAYADPEHANAVDNRMVPILRCVTAPPI